MIVIQNISEEKFALNGVSYAKIFHPLKQGSENIAIYNINDTRHQILDSTLFSQIQIDGVIYGSQLEVIDELLNVIYDGVVPYRTRVLFDEKTDKGGYTGNSKNLKDDIDSVRDQIPTATLPNANVTNGVTNSLTDASSGAGIIKYLANKKINENFVDDRQANPLEFTLLQPTNRIEFDNEITITKTGSQSKIRVPNTTVVGQKYILILNVENIKNVHPNVTGLRFFNFSQSLFTYSLSETKKIVSVVFTSSVDNVLQILVNGNVGSTSGIDEGTDLITFNTQFVGCIEWTQEKEDYWNEVSEAYNGGGFENGMTYKAVVAEKANSLAEGFVIETEFPESSFQKIESLADKVNIKTADSIVEFNSFTNAFGTIVNEVQNGRLIVEGSKDYSQAFSRMYVGFDVQPLNYATEDKSYVVAIKGNINANNCRNFSYQVSGGSNTIILQDLENDVDVPFESIIELNYSAGQTSNQRYSYTEFSRTDSNVDLVRVAMQFDVFTIFEKVEGYSLSDYINASEEGLIIPLYSPIGVATEEFVDNQVNQAINGNSRLSSNDLNPVFDIEMILSGGQSLNVGGGAASALNDFKNSPSFALGTGLFNRAFGTQAEKNAFFGNEFVLIEDNNSNESYPPINASLTTMLSLLEKENKVDVENFGFQIMPFAWGVSGSSITTMEKGTTAYNNMIEVVTKAKEFSNNEGKTFGVRSMNWYHGEADRNRTKQDYYNRLSQLFIDVNADIKLITGQTIDIQFFSYQTSGWLGRNVGTVMQNINVQEAQVQVARDFDNVHIAGAMYQFDYSDFYHPVDRAVIGLQTGVAMKRVLIDGEEWADFKPISHEVLNASGKYYTRIKFDVPVKPMRFDVSGGLYNNPRGKQPNFGFQVLNVSGVEVQTAEPFIIKGDTVVLTTDVNPTGFNVRYAVNGHDGGGNLCDSQNVIVRNKGVDYNIDNFAVAFSEFVIL